MEYFIYQPLVRLQDFIKFFWVFETQASPINLYVHSATASGCAKLAFQYQGSMGIAQAQGKFEKVFTTSLQAQTQRAQKFITSEKVGVFGIYFHPYALPYLFSVPAEALNNQHVEVSSLLGRPGLDLEEQIMTAKTHLERINIASAFFEKRLDAISVRHPGIIASIHHIIRMQGVVNIDDLVQRNFLSQRQFERNFKTVTGFSPKMFSRIVRFENCIDLYLKGDVSLTEIAYTFGYYDQSHFIRDFKEFAGEHPSAYFSQDLSMFTSV